MQKSSFFNSVGGDRKYNASDYAEYFKSFISNGVYPNPSTNLLVKADSGMNILVSEGKAFINGYFYVNTTPYNLEIGVADGVLKRIDLVVLKLDHVNREITLSIKKGISASAPIASEVERSVDVHELCLAKILIDNGVTSITQSSIADMRLDKNLCGIVHGVIEQVDTTYLLTQYQSKFDEWFSEDGELRTAWDLWFANLRDELKDIDAADQELRINEVEKSVNDFALDLTKVIEDTEEIESRTETLESDLNGVKVRVKDGQLEFYNPLYLEWEGVGVSDLNYKRVRSAGGNIYEILVVGQEKELITVVGEGILTEMGLYFYLTETCPANAGLEIKVEVDGEAFIWKKAPVVESGIIKVAIIDEATPVVLKRDVETGMVDISNGLTNVFGFRYSPSSYGDEILSKSRDSISSLQEWRFPSESDYANGAHLEYYTKQNYCLNAFKSKPIRFRNGFRITVKASRAGILYIPGCFVKYYLK